MKQEILQKLTDRLNSYKREIDFVGLTQFYYIVTVGEVFTVAKGENSEAIVSNAEYPSQWTEDTANFIISNCEWRNGKDEVLPMRKLLWKDWYRERIEEIEELIADINNKL
jgi:hypothetical protein